jgi:hypothetical protein
MLVMLTSTKTIFGCDGSDVRDGARAEKAAVELDAGFQKLAETSE